MRSWLITLIRVGVVGLGGIGKIHLMNCRHIEGTKIEGCADVSVIARKKAIALSVKKVYKSYNDLFRSKSLDAVIISIPNHLHFECITEAAERGIHIFVEKPLAKTVEECKKIIDLIQRKHVKLMVGYRYRFCEPAQRVYEMYTSGQIGDIEIANFDLIMNGPFGAGFVPQNVPEWYFDPQKIGGGVLLESGDHMIDLARWFFGDLEVQYALVGNRYELPYEDKAIILLKSKSGNTNCIITTGWFQKLVFPKLDFRVVLHGTAGFISTDSFLPKNFLLQAAIEMGKNVLRRFFSKPIMPLAYSYYQKSYYCELVHFFDCIKSDTQPLISARDGLEAVKIAHAAYKLAAKGSDLP
jgi:predicted dehydrogenase